jgi:hypothetical protein
MGGGYTPDYGYLPLVDALENFVEALGRQYDGDNRVAFIHLGLLGFWYEYLSLLKTSHLLTLQRHLQGRVAHLSTFWTNTGLREG